MGQPSPQARAAPRGGTQGRGHVLHAGPYLTNYQLLAGDYKVGRHCKVSVEIERSSYNDEWGQTSSGWIRGEIEDDDHDFDPRSARMAQPRGGVDQGDYVGRGRERRFSTICHNHCVDYKSGLAPGVTGGSATARS